MCEIIKAQAILVERALIVSVDSTLDELETWSNVPIRRDLNKFKVPEHIFMIAEHLENLLIVSGAYVAQFRDDRPTRWLTAAESCKMLLETIRI